jgi:hypothetical protein
MRSEPAVMPGGQKSVDDAWATTEAVDKQGAVGEPTAIPWSQHG